MTVSLNKIRWMLRLLGWIKIPLIGYVRPRLVNLDDNVAVVKIKLRRRTRNHLHSMYFGALAIGADVSGGIHAFYFSEKFKKRLSFAFKGMNADFIKRAETDVYFECTDGAVVKKAIEESIKTGERVNETVRVQAYSNQKELVAVFSMVISVKCY